MLSSGYAVFQGFQFRPIAVNQDLYIFILQSILCHMLTSLLILIRNIYEIGIYDFFCISFYLGHS